MKLARRGLILALIHLAIVCSLGAKLLIDRATRPRVWARTMSYDPDLPIRGRYASLRVMVNAPLSTREVVGDPRNGWVNPKTAHLEVRNGTLTAVPDESGSVQYTFTSGARGPVVAFLYEPLAFYIPENVQDPTVRARDEELWVEVTVPRKGAPRPIQLAVKKGESFTPLKFN